MSAKYPGNFITENAPAGYSVYFDGSGDYLTYPPGAGVAFGTGDFTVEFFIYPTASISQVYLMDARNSSQTSSWAIGFNLNNTGAGQFTFFNGVAATAYNESSQSCVLNQWNHCVVVRSGTTFSMYTNGTRVYTTTNSTNFSSSQTTSYIARGYATGSELYYTGYMSNVRIVKGTAVYDPSQTTLRIPTQLLNITNTSLLTCQNPTFVDNSSSALTITPFGDAKVSNFTPFAAYTGFNPALGAAAPGVWTISQAEYYQANRLWPIYDPYFNNTTLLLHGNGTNGAQNNTFLDSSTNNFTITRNGNTTQGTFTPFSTTGWGVYNTGSSYCQLNNADYAISTGDFTIEFWMYCVDDSTYSGSTFLSPSPNTNLTCSLTSGSSNARLPYLEYGGSGTTFPAITGYLNKWTHIAFVRSSGNVTVYQNGVATGAAVSKAAAVGSTANLYLLHNAGDSLADFRGYMSNFRITKAAVYTSNFTPSTTPLTPIANTVLMTFQDNRYKDNSANNSTVTPSGSNAVQAFSPFVPAYITPTTYSNYFSGSSAYLTLPANSAFNFNSGDFTLETWVYMPNFSAFQEIFSQGSGNFQGIGVYITTAAKVNLDLGNGSSWYQSYLTTSTLTANSWNHIAIVRQSTTYTIYINGVSGVSGTQATYPSNASASSSYIGIYGPLTSQPFTGFMSNYRIVKGTAVYTAAFTPPTAPLTAITNTQLLTCQSSTFIDNSSNAFTITATGTTYPVSSPTPFAPNVDTTTLNSAYSTTLVGGSGYFDGSGDYLTSPSNAAYQFDSGNFTVEAWIYFNNVANAQFASIPVVGALYWQYFAGALDFGNNAGGSVQASWSPKAYTWYHLAAVRNGSTFTNYINGAVHSSGTAFNITATGTLQIGYGAATGIDTKRVTITTIVFLAGISIGNGAGCELFFSGEILHIDVNNECFDNNSVPILFLPIGLYNQYILSSTCQNLQPLKFPVIFLFQIISCLTFHLVFNNHAIGCIIIPLSHLHL